MSDHRITLAWRRNTPDFEYATYGRDHIATFKGSAAVPLSAAPVYRGNPSLADPEDLLVASLSSCHMLTFLAVAAKRRHIVNSYDDEAVGTLEKDSAGRISMTRVVLRPRVTFESGHAPGTQELDAIHHEAHEACFIANSVKTEVTVEPRSPHDAMT